MKTTRFIIATLAGVLLAAQSLAATDTTAGWKSELSLAQQAYNQDADGRARADALLSTVLDAVRNGLTVPGSSGRSTAQPPAGANLDAAAAQAAFSALSALYPGRLPALDATLAESLAAIDDTSAAIAAGREWGRHVAGIVLGEQGDAVARNTSSLVRALQAPADTPVHRASERATIIGPGRYRFSVLAGKAGNPGTVDGVGAAARFATLNGITVDAAGNVYVSEYAGVIRRISPDGVVTTLAGSAGQAGSEDGPGSAARFRQPLGVAVDNAGHVYVADQQNRMVRKIDPSGVVTTIAGAARQAGDADGAGAVARFQFPAYVAVDDARNVFVSEWTSSGGRIRKITPDGVVSTLRVTNPADFATAKGQTLPMQLRTDRAGNLYVIYSDASTGIWKLTPTGGSDYVATEIAAPPASWAFGLAFDSNDNLYVGYGGYSFRQYTPEGVVQTHHTAGNGAGGWAYDMTVDRAGRVFVLPDEYDGSARVEVGTFDPTDNTPIITSSPASRNANRGESVQFEVLAMGGPGMTFQWHYNNNPIAGATGSVLLLENLQYPASGSYSVVVSDTSGSVTSGPATLGVLQPPGDGVSGGSGNGGSSGGSGGGNFEGGMSLAFLALLAAAATRRFRKPARSRPDAFPDMPAGER